MTGDLFDIFAFAKRRAILAAISTPPTTHSTHSLHLSQLIPFPRVRYIKELHMELIGLVQWFIRLEHQKWTAFLLGST